MRIRTVPEKKKISGFRNLAGAMGIAFAVLFLLEAVLGLLPLSQDGELEAPGGAYPLFVKGEGPYRGYYITNPHFKGSLNFQTFRIDKGKGSKRVFVLGGSAAYGWPGGDELSFAGYIRRALEGGGYGGRIEIVNAAGMSYGSHRVRNVLDDVLALQPDMVIVYSGNNEYIEKNLHLGGDLARGRLPSLRDRLRGLSIYRALRRVLFLFWPGHFQERTVEDITDFRVRPGVVRQDPARSEDVDREVLRNFGDNMEAISRKARNRGVPVTFCTVPVPLADWAPRAAMPGMLDEVSMKRWVEEKEEVQAALAAGDLPGAAAYLEKVIDLTPEDSGSVFELARIRRREGEGVVAYGLFSRARDLDGRPIRTMSAFNLRIKSLADGGARVRVLDLDRLFSSRADGGIPGDDLFLDYCHFNGEGARLAAGAVLKEIDAVLGLDLPLEQLASSIREDRAGENITRDQKAHLVYARALALHNAGRLDEAEDYYRQVVGLDPGFAEAYSNLGAILLDQGQIREAEVSLRAALERDPRDVAAHYNLGQVLAVKGDLSGARSLFAAGRELDPENASFYQALGQLALLAGDFGQAVGHYEDALRLGRNNLSLRTGLARAFLGMGQAEKARSEAVRVLSLDPGNREALEVLHSSGSERKDGE